MYEYDSRVRLTEVDQERKMTLNAVLNAFQDCSTFHSEDLGVGMKVLEERKRMWVLSSWKIVVYRYPELAEHIRIGTWPYAFGALTGQRNFRLMDADGQMAACADTNWVFMDTVRMRPTRVDREIAAAYELEPRLDMEEDTGKIEIPEELELMDAFPIHSWHLDVNHHVNNGQYVQFAAGYLPEDFVVHQMRAEYKKSAVLGDVICPRVGSCQDGYTVILGDEAQRPYAVVEFK
ncbi:MAG: acyl-[acyl-carrier-protein] thioesterase [Clostridiales bacterium]|nr:acyl-[acyl-carrier-protein] thioesterase [Clostridiales bacterium]